MSATPIDKLSKPELQQLALSYAAFVLGDSGAKVNATTLQAVLDAAGVQVDKAWVTQFGKVLESRPIDSFCVAGGSGAGAAADGAAPAAKGKDAAKDEKKDDKKKDDKKPAAKEVAPPPPAEEEGVDMGGLFDF